jgi:2-polyprenyl-3-methyl-5-hydroxy-6-metoxy-1,4-benzoquinol methylase
MSEAGFWADRVRRHGHTGWSDAAVYAYDQRLRLAAVRSLLPATRAPAASALDFGCGSGDFCTLLAEHYGRVVGYDNAAAVIEVARARHRGAGIEFTADLESALRGPHALVISITVLQHVLDDAELARVVARLAGSLQPGGRFVVLETFAGVKTPTASHTRRRRVEDFVRACAAARLQLRLNIGFYHPSECPTHAFQAYRRRFAVRALGRLASWQLPGARATLNTIGERAADADREALAQPASPTRLMLFEREAR